VESSDKARAGIETPFPCRDTDYRGMVELKQSDSSIYCDVEYSTAAVIVGRRAQWKGGELNVDFYWCTTLSLEGFF
jgi:hypothetical protein